MAVILDASTGTALKVDTTSQAARFAQYSATGARISKTQGSAIDSNDEAVPIAGRNDNVLRHIRVDRYGGIATASNTPLFSDQFDGATIHANKWSTLSTTMTAAQTAAVGQTFNNGNITTINTGVAIKSLKTFYRPLRSITLIKFRFKAEYYTNAIIEIGLSDLSSATGTNLNGIYLQWTAAGVCQLVWTYNATDVTSSAITGLSNDNYYTADIILDDDRATIIIQDTSNDSIVAERTISLGQASPKQFAITRPNLFARLANSGTAPASAPHLFLSYIEVVQLDITPNKEFSVQTATHGLTSAFIPNTGLPTITWTNSAEPGSATLSNTTAGYTTLGGKFQFAAVAGAVTDYVLFGYTVPAPFSFHCTGIDIETWNTGAAVATTPTLLTWGIGTNQSAVSLATANIARLPVGAQQLAVGAAIGAKTERISVPYKEPKITDGGRFFTVILRMPVGTATASQVIAGMVTVHGYFE